MVALVVMLRREWKFMIPIVYIISSDLMPPWWV